MKGWKEFEKLMLDAAQEVIKPSFENYGKELGEVLLNRLYNIKGPTVVDRTLNKKEIFFGKLFRGFTEIFKSIEALKDIEIYIGTFPYRNKKITKLRYLRYNIENYFHEIYLLKNRLISYGTIIDRRYKKDVNTINIEGNIKSLVENSLKNITDIRGKHVHLYRIEFNNLERLELMELLTSIGEEPLGKILANYYKLTFIKIRNEWKQIIMNNNKTLVKLFDIYSDIITEILFDGKTGKLIYPNG